MEMIAVKGDTPLRPLRMLLKRRHTAFYNIGFSEAKALFRQKLARKWGHAIARGWATLLLDRLRDFVVVPSSAGGNSSFEQHSQSTWERAILDRYHHSHGHSGISSQENPRGCWVFLQRT